MISRQWQKCSRAILTGLLAALVTAASSSAEVVTDLSYDHDPMLGLAQRISDGAGAEQQALFLEQLCRARFRHLSGASREIIDAHYGAFMPLFLRYQHPGCARQVDLDLHDWFMARANAEQDSAMRAMLRMWLLSPDAPPCPFLPDGVDPEPVQLGDRVTAAELLSDLRDTRSVGLIAALADSMRCSGVARSSRDAAVCRYLELALARIASPASATLFVQAPDGTIRIARGLEEAEEFLVRGEPDTCMLDISAVLECLQRGGQLVERIREEMPVDAVTLVFAGGARVSVAAWDNGNVILADNLRSRPNALVVRHDRLRSALAAAMARVERAQADRERRTAN